MANLFGSVEVARRVHSLTSCRSMTYGSHPHSTGAMSATLSHGSLLALEQPHASITLSSRANGAASMVGHLSSMTLISAKKGSITLGFVSRFMFGCMLLEVPPEGYLALTLPGSLVLTPGLPSLRFAKVYQMCLGMLMRTHITTELPPTLVFPARRTVRKRTFFSDTTWDLCQQRVWLRKAIRRISAKLCCSWERSALLCWRQGQPFSLTASDLSAVLRGVADIGCHVTDLRSLHAALRRAIAEDKRRYTHDVALQAISATTKDTVQKLRPLIGPPKRKQRGAAALPAIRLEDGTLAPDKDAADERWLRHFSSVEDGAPVLTCMRSQAGLTSRLA